MSNRILKVFFVGFFLFCSFQLLAEDRYFVVGKRGEFIRATFSDNSWHFEQDRLAPVLGRTAITDFFFDPAGERLLFSLDSGLFYQLDLNDEELECKWINSVKEGQGPYEYVCQPWLDMDTGRPAWLFLPEDDDGTNAKVHSLDDAGNIIEVESQNIAFRCNWIFSGHIEKIKTTEELIQIIPAADFLRNSFPTGQWIITGRSERIEMWVLRIADLTKEGEPFKSVRLFFDRQSNKCFLKKFNNTSRQFLVLDQLVILPEFFLIKGGKDEVGNFVQAKPTGKCFFVYPGSEDWQLFEHQFDSAVRFHFADNLGAVMSLDRKVYSFDPRSNQHEEPNFLFEIPDDFVITTICVIREKEVKNDFIVEDEIAHEIQANAK